MPWLIVHPASVYVPPAHQTAVGKVSNPLNSTHLRLPCRILRPRRDFDNWVSMDTKVLDQLPSKVRTEKVLTLSFCVRCVAPGAYRLCLFALAFCGTVLCSLL